MASPQHENGHLDIANELVEVLAKTHLTGNEWQILWAVWRKTWCWKKKVDWISLTQLEKTTTLNRVAVCRAKASLVSKTILLEENGKIGLNKDYDGWVVTKTTLVSKTAIGSVKKVLGGSVKNDTYKRNYTKETNTKEMGVIFTSHTGKKIEMEVAADYVPDHKSPLDTLQNKRRLEKALGMKKANKWGSFIFGTGWDFLTAYENTQKLKYTGNVLLEEVVQNLGRYYEAGETRESLREMLADFFQSEKAKRLTISPKTALSTDTYNSWKQGKLKPINKQKKWL